VIEVLSESKPVANKEHNCDACDHLLHYGYNGTGLTMKELRSVAVAKRNNWKIAKGQQYIRQNNKFEGELYTFKAIPEIHEICLRLNFYEV